MKNYTTDMTVGNPVRHILLFALPALIGQNYGAQKNDRVRQGYRYGLTIMVCLTAIMMVSMQFFGRAITSLFVEDETIIAMGAQGLKVTSLFYLALGLIYVVRGVLTGLGDAFFALFNGIIEVIGRFTIPILLTQYMGMGAIGIWLASGIVWVLSGSTAWMRLFCNPILKHRKTSYLSRISAASFKS